MSSSNYYVLRYNPKDSGCPVVLSGFFNFTEFEWDPLEPNPMGLSVEKKYVLKLSGLEMELSELEFDYYSIGDTYVSKRFLEACDKVGGEYKAIPLEITYKEQSRKGDFFIFLPGESLAALDKAESLFEASKDLETGLEIESHIYPGAVNIDAISKFVVSSELQSEIFRCQETLELFCSESFKSAATGLKGVSFEIVDDTYSYDAWTELRDI
ncbi:imm11 family protein [Pseudomonas sp. BNK-30]|uniref:imm11 family protein n=1 Tax=Pseudomonas sp. BNK-30 TaxID=3376165 RepID=UPI0039BEF3B1